MQGGNVEEESSSCTDDCLGSISGVGLDGSSVRRSSGNSSRLYRSRSLPHVFHHDSGVGFSGSYSGIEYDGNATHNADGTPIPGRCSIHHHRHRNGGGDIEIDKASYAANKLVADIRQLLTLKQHYYPEGNWGWVIVFVSVLVQILTHGLQVGSGVLTQEIVNKFGKQIMLPADDSGVATSADLPSGLEEEDIEFDPRPVSSSSSLEYNQRYSANIVVESPGEFEDEDEDDIDGVHRREHVTQNGLNYHDSNDNEQYHHRHHRHHRNRSHGSNTTVGSGLTFKHAAHCTANTIRQHYYPEGGWGWIIVVVAMIVQILTHGLHLAWGILLIETLKKFPKASYVDTGWLGALSTGVALLVSPVTIAFCRRKSTRLTAVMGGLVTALGCLFTSFASQFHQLFFSYGTVVGVGVGMTRDCSTLMVAQYFKRRREFVEIFIVSGSGLGIAIMSAFIKGAISAIGWRFGLQVITVAVFFTFFLGTFYRSASLYHPQRRAILHLKNQKRKIKDKNKVDDRPPFFDFSTLRSKTVRILLMSTGISAFGINTPIFYLAHQAEEEGLGDTAVLLQTYLGLAWTLGCAAFGILVVHNNVECRIARQYLCQAAVFMCGLSILALTAVKGNYHGYVMFAWIYGIFCGGYHYSLKMYTYERVRARNFARTWGFVQCSQAIPIAIGVPISGYINVGCGGKAGYYFSSTCVLVGSLALFLIDLHRRNLSRHKHTRANGTKHLCVSDNCPQRRRLSFTQEPDNDGLAGAPGAAAAALIVGNDLDGHHGPADGYIDTIAITDKPELTCISEEGIADMDLPDNILDDLDYIGDCITSCNKVENYLMLSEFENNLIAEMPVILDRKGRRWSIAKSRQNTQIGNAPGIPEEIEVDDQNETSVVTMHQQHQPPINSGRTSCNAKWTNKPSNTNATEKSNFIQQRTITVIDEASV